MLLQKYFGLVQSTDAYITMPPAICAQSFESTLAWATPIPEAIIIYIIWRSQIQNNIAESLEFQGAIKWNGLPKDTKELSSNTAFKNVIKNMQLRN